MKAPQPTYASVVGLADDWFACQLGAAFWPSPGGAGRAGRCDFGVLGVASYLIGSVRGSERLCVRICARRLRPKDGTGGVLVILEDR